MNDNLITHSYYCCSKDLLNKINCVDGTTILTLNCQSLSAKYDSICIFLRSMQYKIDEICLQETWCETQSIFPLDHYNYVATCCTATKHGGLITYICICLRYAELRNRFIKPYYINSPSRIKFTQLMNSDNVKDMKSLASFIKSLFNWYNMYLFI